MLSAMSNHDIRPELMPEGEHPATSSTLATPLEQRWAREGRSGTDEAWDALSRVVLLGVGLAFLVAVMVWAGYLFVEAAR